MIPFRNLLGRFVVVMALGAAAAMAQSPTFSIEVAGLNGSPINPRVSGIIVEPTDELTVEVFVRNWSGGNSAPLAAYQFTFDPASYTSGTSGNLFPRNFANTTDLNGLCTSGGTAGTENPANAFITTGRSDFVHFGLSPFTSVDSESCGYRFGSAVAVDGPISVPGVKQYVGTIVLKVSPNALGTFTISLNPSSSATALWRSAGQTLGPISYEHLSVTVVPSADLNILSSVPFNNSIDARQPVRPDGSGAAGFNMIDLIFNKSTSNLSPADFALVLDPPGGTPPAIQTLVPNGNNARLTLNTFIPPGKWTTFRHQDATPTSTRLGYLPGDVNGDKLSQPSTDTPAWLAAINLFGALETWQWDIDRDGTLTLLDLTALMNVYNGAGAIDAWAGQALP